MVHNPFIFIFNLYKVSMISNKKTIAISAIAIAAVIAVFAATPFVVAHEAQAFRGGWGFGRGFGFGRFGGWGFGYPGWGWGGGCCGCGCGCGGWGGWGGW
jgi:hypothetical protein